MGNQIDEVLDAATNSERVPGAVAMAQRGDGPRYQGAFGVRGVDEPAAMTADTVFRIASMTKALTSTAAMQLVERGTISLDTPVAELVPEWGDKGVLDGWDGDQPRLRAPRTVATIRHLSTHTSGATYEFFNADHARHVAERGHPALISGLRETLSAPLAFDPGTGWMYGDGIDWLGLCVEAASGQTLDRYFEEHITGPLGMTDTRFGPTDEQRSRLATVHLRVDDGTVAALGMDWPRSPEWWAGGHGLYSTTGDYMRFLDMFRRNGTSDEGTPVLTPATIEVMTSDQCRGHPVVPMGSSAPMIALDFEFFPGSPKVHST
ncbi:MAG: serine hydrolase domain-containing protein, partial [Acidimicrobiia bacterium]